MGSDSSGRLQQKLNEFKNFSRLPRLGENIISGKKVLPRVGRWEMPAVVGGGCGKWEVAAAAERVGAAELPAESQFSQLNAWCAGRHYSCLQNHHQSIHSSKL